MTVQSGEPALAGQWRDVSSRYRADGGGCGITRSTTATCRAGMHDGRGVCHLGCRLGRGGQFGGGAGGVCGDRTARVELHSFDRTTAPLAFAIEHAAALGYPAPHTGALEHLLEQGEWRNATGSLLWQFQPGDFRETMRSAPAPHAILYDPYSPATNPELWSLEQFRALHEYRPKPGHVCSRITLGRRRCE